MTRAAAASDTFDGPGGTDLFAEGINNGGQITETYLNIMDNEFHGFLLGTQGNAISFFTDDPLGITTQPNGINDAGRIVGTYSDEARAVHGFLATVDPNAPPPAGTTAVMILRGADTSAVTILLQLLHHR